MSWAPTSFLEQDDRWLQILQTPHNYSLAELRPLRISSICKLESSSVYGQHNVPVPNVPADIPAANIPAATGTSLDPFLQGSGPHDEAKQLVHARHQHAATAVEWTARGTHLVMTPGSEIRPNDEPSKLLVEDVSGQETCFPHVVDLVRSPTWGKPFTASPACDAILCPFMEHHLAAASCRASAGQHLAIIALPGLGMRAILKCPQERLGPKKSAACCLSPGVVT